MDKREFINSNDSKSIKVFSAIFILIQLIIVVNLLFILKRTLDKYSIWLDTYLLIGLVLIIVSSSIISGVIIIKNKKWGWWIGSAIIISRLVSVIVDYIRTQCIIYRIDYSILILTILILIIALSAGKSFYEKMVKIYNKSSICFILIFCIMYYFVYGCIVYMVSNFFT